MNADSPGLLRTWPAHASWQVLLVHTKDGRYACLTTTGQTSNGMPYFFGIDEDPINVYILLVDRNPEAVQGQTINVLVDNTLVGSYPVDKQSANANFASTRAAVPHAQVAKLLSLLKVGGSVQFETGEATYSASLDGMTDAMGNVQNCLTEAGALAGSK